MELELPEDGNPNSSHIEVHDTRDNGNGRMLISAAATGGNPNGDLNSRLNSMMESIPGMVKPRLA